MSYTLIMSFILLAIIYIIYSFYSTIEKCRLSLKRIEIELNNIRKIKDGWVNTEKDKEMKYRDYEGNPAKVGYYPMINSFSDHTEISMKNAEKELYETWSAMNRKGIKEI